MTEYEYDERKYNIQIIWNGQDLSRYFRIYAAFGLHDQQEQYFAIDFRTPQELFSDSDAISSQLISAEVKVNGLPYRVLQENPIRLGGPDKASNFKALLLPQV